MRGAQTWKSIDWWIVGSLTLLLSAGLATLFSFGKGENLFGKQLIWIGGGLVVAWVLARIDVRFLRDSRYVSMLYVGSLLLLGAVLVFGKTIKGAQSWFDLGSFSLQPTDIAKLALMLILAKYFARRHVAIGQLKHLLISVVYVAVPACLILLQPDFGSVIIVSLLWLGMALVAGIGRKHIMIAAVGVAAAFLIGWFFLFAPYQKARITTFLQPTADIRGAGYNAYQSLIAVGSGGIFGKGFGYGTQSRLNFLPEYETDFIFAAFAEEWGFLGSVLVIGAFFVLLFRIIVHALRAHSNFETLFMTGYALVLFGHVMINIGMNIGVMPVTGLPLPFMSYGGSHIIAELIGLGIVLSMIRYERGVHREDIQKEFVGYA